MNALLSRINDQYKEKLLKGQLEEHLPNAVDTGGPGTPDHPQHMRHMKL